MDTLNLKQLPYQIAIRDFLQAEVNLDLARRAAQPYDAHEHAAVGRKHETLKGKTPAMASGLSDHVWEVKELIERAAEA